MRFVSLCSPAGGTHTFRRWLASSRSLAEGIPEYDDYKEGEFAQVVAFAGLGVRDLARRGRRGEHILIGMINPGCGQHFP